MEKFLVTALKIIGGIVMIPIMIILFPLFALSKIFTYSEIDDHDGGMDPH